MFHDEKQHYPTRKRKKLSVYERWSWNRCRDQILSLKQRLGYDDHIWILGFNILDNGCIVDPFHEREVFNPTNTCIPWSIPYHSTAVAEMYCLLSTYANATETTLSREQVSLHNIDTLQRFTFQDSEVNHLLQYREQDFHTLSTTSPYFFTEKLQYGDLSLVLRPLPRIPITIILWHGEDEIQGGGTILFDKTISHYLPGLTIELAGLTVWRLRNILNPTIKWGYSTHQALRS